ncbi:MAG: hypothetical protein ACI4TE_08560 [Alphaproteobacteria bacterium]
MTLFKIFLAVLFFNAFTFPACAESISEAASRISKAKEKKAELEKESVRAGQQIQDIGSLTIEDFLELEAVPEGMDAVSAQALYGADQGFDFMTTQQALLSIAAMRKQGISLPEDLEEKIKKNPEMASQLMDEAFEAIPPAQIEDKDDIARQRRSAIKGAETTLGISFKDILENQKKMMTPASSKKSRRGKRRQ